MDSDVTYLSSMSDQYVISAIRKEDGAITNNTIVGIKYDLDVAVMHDVSAYDDPSWNVFVEHFRVDERGIVKSQHMTRVLYPAGVSIAGEGQE